MLDENGNDTIVLNVRKPKSIVKRSKALRRRSRSNSLDENLASALVSWPVISILRAFIIDRNVLTDSILSESIIIGRSGVAYEIEEERAPRPISVKDIASVTNDGVLITSSGEAYRKEKGKVAKKIPWLEGKKVTCAQFMKGAILACDEQGSLTQYDAIVRPLISESSYQILEISVGITHALFRTSSGLLLSYGTGTSKGELGLGGK